MREPPVFRMRMSLAREAMEHQRDRRMGKAIARELFETIVLVAKMVQHGIRPTRVAPDADEELDV